MGKTQIHCFLHNDTHPSAFIDEDYFFCSVCGGMSLEKAKEKARQKGTEDSDIQAKISKGTARSGGYRSDKRESLAEILERNGTSLLDLSDRGARLESSPGEWKDYLVFASWDGSEVGRYTGHDSACPRYKNDTGGKTLFSLREVEGDTVIMVEGPFDLLAIQRVTHLPVVAMLGTPSEDQLYSLRNKTVFTVFDNDATGHKYRKDIPSSLRDYNARAVNLVLPDEWKDPGAAHAGGDRSKLRSWLEGELAKYIFSQTVRREIPKPVAFRPTGWRSVDTLFGGGMGPGMHVFVGGPSAGKTALLLALDKQFVQAGYKVAVCEYEISEMEWMARYQAFDLNANILDVMKGTVRPQAPPWNEKFVYAPTPAELFYWLDISDVLIIDYIQLAAPKGKDKKDELDRLVRELGQKAAFAGKLVLVGSQTQKANYRKPSLGSAADTGAIEQTAITLSVLRKYEDRLKLMVKKNRHGKQKADIWLNANWNTGVLFE